MTQYDPRTAVVYRMEYIREELDENGELTKAERRSLEREYSTLMRELTSTPNNSTGQS